MTSGLGISVCMRGVWEMWTEDFLVAKGWRLRAEEAGFYSCLLPPQSSVSGSRLQGRAGHRLQSQQPLTHQEKVSTLTPETLSSA